MAVKTKPMGGRVTFILAGAVVVLLVALIGLYFSSRPALVASKSKEIESLKAEIESKQSEIKKLKDDVLDTSVKEVKPESSLQIVNGSVASEFKTIGDQLVLPNALGLNKSFADVSNSNIMVGSKFKFTPSTNWTLKMSGSSLDVAHPSKIWGQIKGVMVKDITPIDEVQSILQKFFEGYPATTITYKKVFIDDKVAGMLANAPIKVDGKDCVLLAGIVQRTENAVLFLFYYNVDNSGVQQELVEALIKSGTYGENRLKLE